MEPERWQKIEHLYHLAMEQEVSRRAAFVKQACGEDESLRQEVERILAHAEAEDFLETPALDLAARDLARSSKTQVGVGSIIGPYLVVREIGRGGMGCVYLAQRADEQFRRSVALKALDPVLVDRDTLRRFQNERQTLASLDHPNIIKLLDGGTTDSGLPWLVMDYVEGQTIDLHCDNHNLGVPERLKLFRLVCAAVHYAHQNLVIHRDLKPGNILVTAEGIPKLLDFGISKLLRPDFLPHTLTSLQPMTPQFASPEQIRGLPLTPSSDIYSLGVLLYYLVTGQHPHTGGSLLDLQRAICETDPEKPSSAAYAQGVGGPASAAARNYGRNYGISGDLDKIVLMAMRKEPQRRYSSAADLAEDIRRYLEREPVAARGNTLFYRASKFIARHRIGVTAAALSAVALVASGAVAWHEKDVAELRLAELKKTATLTPRRLRLLVSTDSPAVDPALSPDGKMLAYVTEEGGQRDLFVGQVDGGGRVRLTNDEAWEADPRFSPDGDHILYKRLGGELRTPEIWSVPTQGGESRRVVSQATFAAWSPDGKRIAFISSTRGKPEALATAAADGTDRRVVMLSDDELPFFRRPAWSPDGTKLAVTRSSGGDAGDLWIVPLDGGPPRQVSHDEPGIFSDGPVFTPDGGGLIHESNRGGATNLWILFLNGSRLERLTTGPGPDRSSSVAQDGSIAFSNWRSREALIVQDLATGQAREVLTHSSVIWAPAFSPNGREIAFSRAEDDGSWHIWIVPLQGGAARRLTSGTLPEIYPRFTPNGAELVYHTWSPGPDRVWRVPQASGTSTALTPARGQDDQFADISPDGRWLAFARTEKDITRVYIAPVNGGEARRLTDSPSTLPRWSPDGRRIAFSRSRSDSAGIFLIGADGSGMRQLSETGCWPVWWPDGKQIAYQNIGPDGSEQILTVPFEGGLSRPLRALRDFRFHGTNFPIDISPDGKLLATSNDVDVSSSIWLLSPGH